MPHEAEIRISHAAAAEAVDPGSILVRHHRVPVAELRVPRVTGGRLLHLALAGCVFGNLTRMAEDRGIVLREASVRVSGDFTPDGDSTGIECAIAVDGEAEPAELRSLVQGAYDDSTVAAVLKRATEVSLSIT